MKNKTIILKEKEDKEESGTELEGNKFSLGTANLINNVNSTGMTSGIIEYLSWAKRQSDYLSFALSFALKYDLKKGEIYKVDFGINVNSEFSYMNYALVLKDSKPFDPLVLVCPLKQLKNEVHSKCEINIGYIQELNNPRPFLALINQIRTVDKLRIVTKTPIGEIVAATQNKKMNDSLELYYALNEFSLDPSINGIIPQLSPQKVSIILNEYINYLNKNFEY